jgi:CO/xanthine dehydrogenase FAD-binding subunit
MEFVSASTLREALEVMSSAPGVLPIAGGTDVMVAMNFGRSRPETLLDLTRVPELTSAGPDGEFWRIGAGVSYARLIREFGGPLPGLAAAARTVGSPQIRNRGTIGGNLGTASPAGDCHPVLLTSGAVIETISVRGTRRIPAGEFFTGPKRNALEPDELIGAVLIPAARGPQLFAKVGTRNAMVIAVCSLALELTADPLSAAYGIRVAIGSAAPVPLRATQAEEFATAALAEAGGGTAAGAGRLPESLLTRFGELVAASARPVDDVRGTADYRRHALAVLARRTLTWAWAELATGEPGTGEPGTGEPASDGLATGGRSE